MQSEERQNGHNHHDKSDQINDPVHASLRYGRFQSLRKKREDETIVPGLLKSIC